ncbi:DUF4199 domain-containing protein [Opitutus sp. ER46]|uniref:DUF4199 domain-containing protein n=1 Tax=Opitutus sp. ER46 TaxID=2161864 RepID=UPI000D320CEB|nr:DUF4199 domain-containing protein [Opitutus sp. ER46]PTX97939.1 hypothetical protein DB354_06600 [Opitutus sp. ER46]
MKTPLLYGALIALVGALLTFGLYFAGYHDTPEKMKAMQWLPGVVGLIASIICLALAMRERRVDFPADRTWGYGSALGTGVMTGLWAALFSAIVAFVYFVIVNPNFSETLHELQIASLVDKGMSQSQIDAAAPMMRKMSAPIPMTIMQTVFGFIWSVILALIIAIFFRKPLRTAEVAVDAPPPLA